MTPEMIGENGILIFYGINRLGDGIKEIIKPADPITDFHYKCTKRFLTEEFEPLFAHKPIGHVVLINGEECHIYQFNGSWKKLKTINGNLIKRQKNGGQSSVRFSRLAEESRAIYITRVVDHLNDLLEPHQNNYVF